MFNKAKKHLIKIPVGLALAGIFLFPQTHAQTKIEKLTSTDKPVVDGTSSSISGTSPKGTLNRHSIGLGFGQTFLFEDFEDNGEDKITVDGFYNYSASHSFDLLVNMHISKHKFRGRNALIRGIAPGIKAKLYQFDNFSPYVLGGLGLYAPKVRRVLNAAGEIQDTKTKMAFGYHFGAGADLNLNSHVTVGLLFHLHNPFDVKQDIGSEVEGAYYKLLMLAFYVF
tara:strand:+ start:229 stop:903 length:675 start_codon:yes stop_codon:yes gene_type:complete